MSANESSKDPCIRQELAIAGINVLALDLLVESFIKSKFAELVTVSGESLSIPLGRKSSMPANWAGLELTIKPILLDTF